MGFKLFLVALLALHSAQALSIGHRDNTDDIFLDLIAKLRANLHEAILDALNILEPMYEEILFAAKENLQQGMLELDAVVRNANRDIDDLEQTAEEAGVDVTACVAERPTLEVLLTVAKKDTTSCMKGEIATLNKDYKRAVDAITEVNQLVHTLIADYVMCADQQCRIEVTHQAISQLFNVKDLVEEAVLDAQTEIENSLSGYEERCIAENRQALRSAAISLYEFIKKCIDGKGGLY